MTHEIELLIRQETTCRGCGEDKQPGCVVCWGCFKYRQDNPFKYAEEADLDDWLVSVGRQNETSTAKPPAAAV